MNKEIRINLSEWDMLDLRWLIVEEVSRILDRIEEYRLLGNHSDANNLHIKIERLNELHEELSRVYDENFKD